MVSVPNYRSQNFNFSFLCSRHNPFDCLFRLINKPLHRATDIQQKTYLYFLHLLFFMRFCTTKRVLLRILWEGMPSPLITVDWLWIIMLLETSKITHLDLFIFWRHFEVMQIPVCSAEYLIITLFRIWLICFMRMHCSVI